MTLRRLQLFQTHHNSGSSRFHRHTRRNGSYPPPASVSIPRHSQQHRVEKTLLFAVLRIQRRECVRQPQGAGGQTGSFPYSESLQSAKRSISHEQQKTSRLSPDFPALWNSGDATHAACLLQHPYEFVEQEPMLRSEAAHHLHLLRITKLREERIEYREPLLDCYWLLNRHESHHQQRRGRVEMRRSHRKQPPESYEIVPPSALACRQCYRRVQLFQPFGVEYGHAA